MNDSKRWVAENTNTEHLTGTVEEALKGADVFIGLSGPGLIKAEWLERMSSDAIVFAMANPIPEVMPEEVPPNVTVVATGRSDYANQLNNVLVFPGFFRGALDCRANGITPGMEVAAARALASICDDGELDPEYIIPSVFDRRVMPAIAGAVREIAEAEGVARLR
jgi:malate dehydrogenase (oxaloacetate-decarboxylating)